MPCAQNVDEDQGRFRQLRAGKKGDRRPANCLQDAVDGAILHIHDEEPHHGRTHRRHDCRNVDQRSKERAPLDLTVEQICNPESDGDAQRHGKTDIVERVVHDRPEIRIAGKEPHVVGSTDEPGFTDEVVVGHAEVERGNQRKERKEEEANQPGRYKKQAHHLIALFRLRHASRRCSRHSHGSLLRKWGRSNWLKRQPLAR